MPALRVPALDATGAGDVFGASLVVGTLAGWSLHDRLSFAALCSSLAVQQFGGSLAAPGWGDIVDWWLGIRDATDASSYACSLRRRYAFLDEIVPRRAPQRRPARRGHHRASGGRAPALTGRGRR